MNARNPGQPRMTIRTLTDYLTASGAHQRASLIENMWGRLGRGAFAPYYQDARNAMRHHASGEAQVLDEEVERLTRARMVGDKWHRGRTAANLRAIADFRDNFSSEEVEHRSRRFAPLIVNGVRISTEPTLSGTIRSGRRTIPCNIIVDCQEDVPLEQEIDYALELLYRGSGQTHEISAAGAQYWHTSSGDAWTLSRPSIRRWRDVEAACREIALRWPTFGQ